VAPAIRAFEPERRAVTRHVLAALDILRHGPRAASAGRPGSAQRRLVRPV